MAHFPKRKPRPEERNAYQEKVTYKGVDYEQTVTDKVGEDGVMESHLSYELHKRPKGAKHRGNFTVGICLPGCPIKIHRHKEKLDAK